MDFRERVGPLVITVASGKGGVGKTTVALVLARAFAETGLASAYLDCDVEAPNGHLMLKPDIETCRSVSRLIPEVDPERCNGCGACERVCEFGAIVALPKGVQVFPNMCLSCGACVTACRKGALGEVEHLVGEVEEGAAGDLRFVQGRLRPGEARNIPVIEAVRQSFLEGMDVVVRDAPPGTACPAVTALEGSDFAVLVTDATPFGLHDLSLIADTVEVLGLTSVVMINRSDQGDQLVVEYCEKRALPVLAQIPVSASVKRAYSVGDLGAIQLELGEPLKRFVEEVCALAKRKESV